MPEWPLVSSMAFGNTGWPSSYSWTSLLRLSEAARVASCATIIGNGVNHAVAVEDVAPRYGLEVFGDLNLRVCGFRERLLLRLFGLGSTETLCTQVDVTLNFFVLLIADVTRISEYDKDKFDWHSELAWACKMS